MLQEATIVKDVGLEISNILKTLKRQLTWRPPAHEFNLDWIHIWELTGDNYAALDKNLQDCLSLVMQLQEIVNMNKKASVTASEFLDRLIELLMDSQGESIEDLEEDLRAEGIDPERVVLSVRQLVDGYLGCSRRVE